ncbi:Aldo/keto reductase [Microthyrium microscopicum]|uniref:Aldo/keto reductase n=1 Tax=Microthyrium microscopicum TaxID=703497 RepID=A0A6A6UL63_9PEZI|nr:Aldo/keto reductase [Microthyrium microscopicum]
MAASNIPLRQLGKNGPILPRLGVGLMGASGVYGLPASDAARLAFLDGAYSIGETFWDTADEYNDSEDVIGKWFAANPEKREDIFLATKFGIISDFHNPAGVPVNSSPEYCKQALDKSLKRLGLPFVDLYYVHRLDGKTPIEKTIEAMVELKDAGKIKYIGLSECSADSLRRAHAVHPITCVQVEYSAFCLAIESPEFNLLKTARELGVAIVAYSPLGNGILTGSLRKSEDFSKPGDLRHHMPWLKDENLQTNLGIVDKLTELAASKGATTPQLALAWLMAQGDDIFAIPGTKSLDRLKEDLASLDFSISPKEDETIRKLSGQVAGERVQNMTGELGLDLYDYPKEHDNYI